MIDLINKLIEETIENKSNKKDESLDDSKIIINNKHYISKTITKNNFSKINEEKSKEKFAFIDGGNQNIHKEDMQSIDLIKINTSIFDKKIKIKSITNSFILITKAVEIKNKILFKLKTISQDKNSDDLFEEIIINPKDEEFKLDKFDLKLEDCSNIIRRIFEIKQIKYLIKNKHITKDDTISLDGSLKTDNDIELKELNSSLELAKKNRINIISILKSGQNYTNKSIGVKTLLEKISPYESFLCADIIDNKNHKHPATITFSKLHKLSDFVLRIEFANYLDEILIKKVTNNLAFFSKDPTIIGYPYGLICADSFARVTNSEINQIKSIYEYKTKKKSSNLHNKLDKISF